MWMAAVTIVPKHQNTKKGRMGLIVDHVQTDAARWCLAKQFIEKKFVPPVLKVHQVGQPPGTQSINRAELDA